MFGLKKRAKEKRREEKKKKERDILNAKNKNKILPEHQMPVYNFFPLFVSLSYIIYKYK